MAVRSSRQELERHQRHSCQSPIRPGLLATVADTAGPLPEPYSNDPTQWLFAGHPVGATEPLQVAVARLLGYRWPQQAEDDLGAFADADGIVCLPAVAGEAPAAERLRRLLAAAYGDAWSAAEQERLLASAGFTGKTLDDWLADGFFSQHCRLFHNRPFIWHVWDGRKDGFSALVNYHKLDRAGLEKLTYTYLGAWINRQRDERDAGVAGRGGAAGGSAGAAEEAGRHPGRGAALRHLRALEAAGQAAHRLGAGSQRRRAAEHPAVRHRGRAAEPVHDQLEQGSRRRTRMAASGSTIGISTRAEKLAAQRKGRTDMTTYPEQTDTVVHPQRCDD